MIIECSVCESKVDAKELARREYADPESMERYAYFFLECPVCHRPILGISDYIQVDEDEWDYTLPKRVWPKAQNTVYLDLSIPKLVRASLQEAKKCFSAKAYSACAVMSGRAIEAVCAHHKTKAKNLAGGLKELKTLGIIDGRLFEWSEALRERRNIGAHATEDVVSMQDAQDVYDFAVAICEYVFVLSQRYEDFTERNNIAKKGKRKPAATLKLPIGCTPPALSPNAER